MKKLIAIIPFFFSNYIIAQYYNLEKESTQLSENLYQLVETEDDDTIVIGRLSSIDPEIKHGEFKFYNNNGTLKVKGEYNQNYPSGTWYYYNNGDVTRELNYGKALELLNADTLANTEETYFVVDEMPKFKGKSSDNFRLYIQENLVYPIYSYHHEGSFRVYIQFVVNEKGEVCNIKIVRGTDFLDMDMEIIRVISESPLWTPGKLDGKEVPVTFTFPIHFHLQ